MAFYLLTETGLKDELKRDYPGSNVIYREDYQRSFKKRSRWEDTKKFLRKYPLLPGIVMLNVMCERGYWRALSQLQQRGEGPGSLPTIA